MQEIIIYLIIVLAVLIFFFTVGRKIFLWFTKTDEKIMHQKITNILLTKMLIGSTDLNNIKIEEISTKREGQLSFNEYLKYPDIKNIKIIG